MRPIEIHKADDTVLTRKGEYRVSYPDIKGEGVGRFSKQELLVVQGEQLGTAKKIRFALPGKTELSSYIITNKTWNEFTKIGVYYLTPEVADV